MLCIHLVTKLALAPLVDSVMDKLHTTCLSSARFRVTVRLKIAPFEVSTSENNLVVKTHGYTVKFCAGDQVQEM